MPVHRVASVKVREGCNNRSVFGHRSHALDTVHMHALTIVRRLPFTIQRGRRGFKSRIRPPYPQRVVKGD